MEEIKGLISSEQIIATVRNTLSTFDEQGLLNQQVMYGWVRECLDRLGLSGLVYKEEVLQVVNNTAWLPERIKEIEEIYSLSPSTEGNKIYFTDHSGYISGHGDTPDLVVDGEYVTSISWFNHTRKPNYVTYHNNGIIPIVITKQAPFGLTDSSINYITREGRRLTVHGSGIHSAFYIKYYGVPVSESGIPEIPDTEATQRAVRTFLIFRFFEKAWYNSEVTDVLNKYQKAEIDFRNAMADAVHEAKLPSFKSMVALIRKQRVRLNTFRQLS